MFSSPEKSVYLFSDGSESDYISPKSNVSSLAESDVETTFPVRFVLYYSKKNGQCMRKKLTLELGGNTTVYDALHKAVATVHSLNKVKEITGRVYYSITYSIKPIELHTEDFDSVLLQDLIGLSSNLCLIFDNRNHVSIKHALAQSFSFWTIVQKSEG